jgi:hypothetical protein
MLQVEVSFAMRRGWHLNSQFNCLARFHSLLNFYGLCFYRHSSWRWTFWGLCLREMSIGSIWKGNIYHSWNWGLFHYYCSDIRSPYNLSCLGLSWKPLHRCLRLWKIEWLGWNPSLLLLCFIHYSIPLKRYLWSDSVYYFRVVWKFVCYLEAVPWQLNTDRL